MLDEMKDEPLEEIISAYKGINIEILCEEMEDVPTGTLVSAIIELGCFVTEEIAIEMAGREDALFWLRKLLQDGRLWHPGKRWDPFGPENAMHILALIGTPEVLQLELDMLRFKEYEIGESLTEYMPYILYRFGEIAIDPLMEFITDETLTNTVIDTATKALVVISLDHPQHTSRVKEHILGLMRSTKDPTICADHIYNLLIYCDDDLLPDINKAFEDDRVDLDNLEQEDVEDIMEIMLDEELALVKQDPLDYFSEKDIRRRFIWYYGEKERA